MHIIVAMLCDVTEVDPNLFLRERLCSQPKCCVFFSTKKTETYILMMCFCLEVHCTTVVNALVPKMYVTDINFAD